MSKLVFVDKKTRKPAPIPEYFRSINDPMVQSEKMEALAKPEITHIAKYRVVWSDADPYQHTNQGAFIRICMDGIVEVGMRRVLTTLTGNIGRYWVKTHILFTVCWRKKRCFHLPNGRGIY